MHEPKRSISSLLPLPSRPPRPAAGPTGPRTEAGRLRSSLNAVRHGLSAQHLILPGEDRAEYERRMDGVFIALAPTDDAQAQLVALVGDDLWKLERLGRIEAGVSLARIEELLGLTQSAERAGRLTNAITAMGTALAALEDAPAAEGSLDLIQRLRALQDALELVGHTEVGLSPGALEECDALIHRLRRAEESGDRNTDAYSGLLRTACDIMAALLKHGDIIDAEQEGLRRAIATIALPNEKELSKMGRYRRILEEGLQRRLQELEQLRRLTGSSSTSEQAERSREFRVRLRLVG